MATTIEDIALDGPSFPEDQDDRKRRLGFLGYLPCAIRGQYRDALWRYVEGELGGDYPWYVPGGCGGKDVYEDIAWSRDPADLPRIVMSIGFGDFFQPEFVRPHVDGGLYRSGQRLAYAPSFAAAGLPDPLGVYNVYAVFPTVMLVDKAKLAGRPVPRRWSDLEDPMYRGDIICGDHDGEISDLLLLYAYQRGGRDAVRRFAANVREVWHGAQMAKFAGSGHPKGAAVYLLNWFFADSCPERDKTRIVWPEDGALTNPLYFIAQKNLTGSDEKLLAYLSRPDHAALFEESRLPYAFGGALLDGRPLRWLGWDFIRSTPLKPLSLELQAIARDSRP